MNRRNRFSLAGVLFLALSVSSAVPQQPAGTGPRVFQIELPDFGVAATSNSYLVIPSTQVQTILIHILNPYAQRIDYGQIKTFINGEASARIADTNPSSSGILVLISLTRRPGFTLTAGRNTVEISAEDRLHRRFYSVFVLRTQTENRNKDFEYSTQLGSDPGNRTPPDIALQTPQHAILMPSSRRTYSLRIAGVASAANSVERVMIDGVAAPLKRVNDGQRKLGLAFEENRITFEVNRAVRPGAENVVVEAVDGSGNRTALKIPIVANSHPPDEFKGKKYALIVGISRFVNNQRGIPNLHFADRDAEAVRNFLQSAAGGSFPPEHILSLLNEQATASAIKAALTTFIAKPAPGDLLLLFMATHGDQDPLNPPGLYFIAHDTDIERMSETAIPMKYVETMLARAAAKRMVMLFDACHSAGLGGLGGPTARGSPNLMNLYLSRMLYREEGTAILTSSDVTESSFEDEKWGGGHGVFTHFVLDGLRGKADENLDGLVTVGELFRFVRQRVETETESRQHPRMLPGASENLTLSAVSSRVSGLGSN